MVRTSDSWLTDHGGAPRRADAEVTCDAARTSGWPAHGGHDAVVFLDDQSIYALLAQVSVGRTATLLVGTIAQPESAVSGQA